MQKEVNQKKGRKGKGAGAGAGDGDDDEQEKEEGEQERRAKDGQSSPGEFLPHLPASANRQTESGQGGKERGGGRGERSRLSGTTGEEEVRHSPLPPSLPPSSVDASERRRRAAADCPAVAGDVDGEGKEEGRKEGRHFAN